MKRESRGSRVVPIVLLDTKIHEIKTPSRIIECGSSLAGGWVRVVVGGGGLIGIGSHIRNN